MNGGQVMETDQAKDFEDNVEIHVVQGELMYFVYKIEGKVACSAMVVVRGMIDMTSMIEIHNINTKEEFRRRGAAKRVVEAMKAAINGSVRYVYTSWKDSTKEGRKLMLSCGLEKFKDMLVWKNPNVRRLVAKEKTEIDISGRHSPIIIPRLVHGKDRLRPSQGSTTPGGIIIP